MEYTVQKLAKLAGVSPRALRHYDQIGLLVPLEDIRALLDAPAFDADAALQAHLQALMLRRKELDVLIANVTRTIADRKGEITMQDEERFAGLREQMIADNEAEYGQEIRARYGAEAVEASNRHLRGMNQQAFADAQKKEEAVRQALAEAVDSGDPAGPQAHRAAAMHYDWLQCWGTYTPEMHIALGEMYVEDARFAAHYEAVRPGAAAFLRDAIARYHAGA